MSADEPIGTWRPVRPMEALERDVIHVLTRAVVVGEFWVDLERVEAFRRARRAARARVGHTALYVKAAALSALQTPALRRMDGRWRVHELAAIDVGVSVRGGTSMLAPVVVIERADSKSLEAIEAELHAKATRARDDAARIEATVARYLRFLPVPAVRRAIIRRFLAAPGRRRGALGAIQISNIGRFGIDLAHVPLVGELLLVAGALRRHVAVEADDRIVVRTGARFAIQGSHRKLSGESAGCFIRRFRALLNDPERLA